MKQSVLKRGVFAAATVMSLGFGAVQAFAAPSREPTGPVGICLWEQCRAECGTGCGGECINNQCYCDC